MNDQQKTLQASGDELAALQQWLDDERSVALATVVQTWGSSPRPVGSHLIIDRKGNFQGSVSGGCIEAAVVAEAIAVLDDQQPRLLRYGVSDEQAWEVGLSCGGSIEIFVQAVSPQWAQLLLDQRHNRQAVALISDLNDRQLCVANSQEILCGDLQLSAQIQSEVATLLAENRSGMLNEDNRQLFVRSYTPQFKLLLIGAVHIAQHLAPMARAAGFQVTVIDPRSAFASAQRFAEVTLLNQWPDEAMEQIGLDKHCAVVTLSHDPKIDDPALVAALNSDAFYIGSLGSTRTHQQRLQRLADEGLTDQCSRIHGPVGLGLGGRSAAEIAISIVAELIKIRYRGAQ